VKIRHGAIAALWAYAIFHDQVNRVFGAAAPNSILPGLSFIQRHPVAVAMGAVLLLLIGTVQQPKRLLRLIGFVLEWLAFPLVVLFWLVPLNLYRAVRLSYRIFKFISRLACSFRFNFALLVCCGWAVWAIFVNWEPRFRLLCVGVVLLCTLLAYIQVFRLLLSPAAIYSGPTRWMLLGWSKCKEKFEETMAKVAMDEAGAEKLAREKRGQIELLQALEKGCGKLLAHLDRVNQRSFVVTVFVAVLAGCFLAIVFSFSVQFYGLSALGGFKPRDLKYIDCVYFSLSNVLTVNFADVVPISIEAKFLACIEVLCGFGLAVIVLLVFTVVSIERFSRDVSEVFKKFSAEMETLQALLGREDTRALVPLQPEVLAKGGHCPPPA
jgi:hypothetical protein